MMKSPEVVERVVALISVDPSSGCWLWQGAKSPTGYGIMKMGGRKGRFIRAHRVSYETLREPVPDGLELDHLCRVRHCVNPWHLEAVTHAENMARGERAQKTHCGPKGHPFDFGNTYVNPRGARECRTCRRERHEAYMERKRAAM